jgi:hypothetical protein
VAWNEVKANHWRGKITLQSPSALNETITTFSQRFAAVAYPEQCSKSKCTPILGGLASSRPPIDIWSPLPKALLASKEMFEKSAFPEAHFCLPPSAPL